MLKPENQKDKQRFKAIQENERRQGEKKSVATQDAARRVKKLRQQEGRSKRGK